MISKKIKDLNENDVLALDISTNDGLIVLAKGTFLSKEYIERLEDFGITEVYILEPSAENPNLSIDTINLKEARKVTLKNYSSIFSDLSNGSIICSKKLDSSVTNIILSVLSEVKKNTINILYNENLYFCHYIHSLNTASLSVYLGIKLDLLEEQLRELAIAALMHDIGMSKLPRYLLDKTENFTDEEITLIKKHTILGYEALDSTGGISDICKKAVLHHHEKYNGTGYPFKLKEKSIPLYSRIITLADMFCSLTSKTKNSLGYSYLDVYEFILANSGNYFDPDIVEIFQKHFVMYPNYTKVTLNTGEKAIITAQNIGFPDRPKIKIMENSSGIEIMPININLINKPNLKIEKIVK